MKIEQCFPADTDTRANRQTDRQRDARIMREISSATLDSAAGGLHVDPEKVSHERFLEIAVDVRVIDNPQQLIDGHDCLTHRLYEPVLTLYQQQHHYHH